MCVLREKKQSPKSRKNTGTWKRMEISRNLTGVARRMQPAASGKTKLDSDKSPTILDTQDPASIPQETDSVKERSLRWLPAVTIPNDFFHKCAPTHFLCTTTNVIAALLQEFSN